MVCSWRAPRVRAAVQQKRARRADVTGAGTGRRFVAASPVRHARRQILCGRRAWTRWRQEFCPWQHRQLRAAAAAERLTIFDTKRDTVMLSRSSAAGEVADRVKVTEEREQLDAAGKPPA